MCMWNCRRLCYNRYVRSTTRKNKMLHFNGKACQFMTPQGQSRLGVTNTQSELTLWCHKMGTP
jgi:hypothetical protein